MSSLSSISVDDLANLYRAPSTTPRREILPPVLPTQADSPRQEAQQPNDAAARDSAQGRTWGELGSDLLTGLQQGVHGIASGINNLGDLATGGLLSYGMGNLYSAATGTDERPTMQEIGQRVSHRLATQESPYLQAQRQQLQREIAAAGQQGGITGGLEKAYAAARGTATNPALLGQMAVEQIPILASMGTGSLAAAGRAGEAARLAGATPAMMKAASEQAAIRANIGLSGALGAGYSSQQAAQDVLEAPAESMAKSPDYQALIQSGLSDRQARQQLAQRAMAPAAAIAGPVSALTARITAPMETAAFMGKLPKGFGPVAAAGVREMTEEIPQESSEQIGQNVGVRSVGLPRDIMAGVPEAAGQAGVAGLLMGAGLSGVNVARHGGVEKTSPESTTPEFSQPETSPGAATPPGPRSAELSAPPAGLNEPLPDTGPVSRAANQVISRSAPPPLAAGRNAPFADPYAEWVAQHSPHPTEETRHEERQAQAQAQAKALLNQIGTNQDEAGQTGTGRSPETNAGQVAQAKQTATEANSPSTLSGIVTQEVPVSSLRLSEDVPQFKSDANPETGVVEPLGGKYERTGTAPVIVWQRQNGDMEVISGRHRLDLARRSGEQTIPAQILREADGFDANRAAILDAELNIRDGQGKIKDYVQYFQGSGISTQEAESRGLLARPTGRRAYDLANSGSPELIAAHRADLLSDDAAVRIATTAPGDARLQAVGLKAVQDGKSAANAANLMLAVKTMVAERGAVNSTGDMFGFDDSAMREAERMAKVATAEQRQVSERLAAVQGAAKRPELARKEGVNVNDPAALAVNVEELKAERAAWNTWSTNPELVARIREMTPPRASQANAIAANPAGNARALAAHPEVKALGDRISVVERQAELRPELQPKDGGAVKAVIDGNRIVLVGEHWTNDDIANMSGVLQHEGGVHLARDSGFYDPKVQAAGKVLRAVGLKSLAGEASWNDVTRQLEALRRGGNESVQKAFAMAEQAGTSPELMSEEALGYLAELNPQHALVRRLVAMVKAALYRMGVNVKLDDAALVALARVGLRSISRVAGGTPNAVRYSRAEALGETDSKLSADELLARVQSGDVSELTPDQWEQVQAAFLGKAAKPTTGVDAPTFKSWFGDSKITNRDGKPLTMYHGTSADFTAFDTTRSGQSTTHPTATLGFFFTNDRAHAAGKYGGNVMEVYLAIKKPYPMTDTDLRSIESLEDAKTFRRGLEARGYDGIVMPAETSTRYVAAFHPDQIKRIDNTSYTRGESDIRYSKLVRWTDNQPHEVRSMAEKIGAEPKPWTERLAEMRDTLPTRIRQGTIDRFARLLDLDRARFGRDVIDTDTALSSWVAAKMSKSPEGALEGAFLHGRLKWDDGALNVQETKQGLAKALEPIASAGELNRFWQWIIAHRSNRLMQEGRERLFTPQEIAAGMRLNEGQMQGGHVRNDVYRKAFARYVEIQKSVLDVAEQAGLFNAAQRAQWEHDFYLPYYRVIDNEGELRGPSNGGGKLIRQKAFEQLKGGTEKLGDPLQNILRNWHHLIDASLKNRAASLALDTAENLGVAEAIPSTKADKNSVWVMKNGDKVHYRVDDPLTLEAISALNSPMMSGAAVKALAGFKRALTIGVTISPAFKARNLLRDSVAAFAVSGLSPNVLKVNPIKGMMLAREGSPTQAALLAGGGTFRFGTMMEGDPAAAARRIAGWKPDTVLNSAQQIKGLYQTLKSGLDAWNRLGDQMETANRASIYEQMRGEGKTHLQASLAARDLMDFSQSGAWPAVRFLTTITPFLNARLQGMDVLYRKGFNPLSRTVTGKASSGERKAALRFAATIATVSLASTLLYLAYRDDKDFQKREQWDRDNYWWFKLGEEAYRIPKPFEVGALGTISERIAEQIVDQSSDGKLFADRLKFMLTQTFAMSLPQAVNPIWEIFANKSAFTGRPIEPMGMENLSPELRARYNTSAAAIAASRAGLGKVGLSPLQIEHLVRGYFGWIGAQALLAGDMAARPAMGLPERPMRQSDIPLVGDLLQSFKPDSRGSRYVTEFYEQAKEVRQVMADARLLIKLGDTKALNRLKNDKSKEIEQSASVEAVARMFSAFGEMERQIANSRNLSGIEKQRQIDALEQQKSDVAREVGRRLR